MPYAKPSARLEWSPADYETRLSEVRHEFAELAEKDRTSEDTRKSITALKNEREDLDFEYRALRAQTGAQLDIEQRASEASRGFGVGSVSGDTREYRTAGEKVIENDGFAARNERGRNGDFSIELRGRLTDEWRSGWETRAVIDDSTGTSALLRPVGQPYLPTQAMDRRRLYLRDALTGGNTSLAAIPYVRELNAGSNASAAATVAPQGTKPDSNVQFVDDLAPVRDIAVTMTVTNQTFEDNQVVISYINGRLSYMVALREEAQFLNGNGTAPNLKGILSYSGVQAQTFVNTDVAQTVAAAIAKIQLANGEPTAVVMNPADYWPMASKRAAGGSGTFDAGTPFSMTPMTLWGLPVIVTNGQAAGSAIVGDWRLGAQYFDRNTFKIESFEQHADYAAKNLRLLRAEERVALAVYRPDWFCVAALAAP